MPIFDLVLLLLTIQCVKSTVIPAYFVSSSSLPYATCQQFQFQSPEQYFVSSCANAVTYPFYVPTNISLEYFELQANQRLNNSQLSILPTACQKSIKNLICSNIYMKCDPVGSSTKIYTEVAIPFVSLPFQRPCKQVCDSVNSKCYGLLSLMGLSQDCTATFDYTFGQIPFPQPTHYDYSNNATQCNSMTANYQVSSSSEPYIGTSCSGIVSQVFVPPGKYLSFLCYN